MPFEQDGFFYLTVDDVFEAYAAALRSAPHQAELALKSRDAL